MIRVNLKFIEIFSIHLQTFFSKQIMNVTKAYIVELVKIHNDVCALKKDDIDGLLTLKKTFSEFIDRVENYHIFNGPEID